MYDVKTRTRRSSLSAFSLCFLASQVETRSKSFENLKEMPTRCVAAGCGMHFIPYYGDERPEPKRRSEEMGRLCETETCEVGTIEDVGAMLSAFQT